MCKAKLVYNGVRLYDEKGRSLNNDGFYKCDNPTVNVLRKNSSGMLLIEGISFQSQTKAQGWVYSDKVEIVEK